MQKICLMASSLGSGGAERTLVGLANYLVNNNWQVDIVVSQIGKKIYEIDDSINIIDLSDNIKSKNKLLKYFFRTKNFKKYLKNNDVKIIYSVSYGSLIYPLLCRKAKKIIKITSVRNNPYSKKDKMDRLFRKFFLNASSAIVVQTERAKEYFTDKVNKPLYVIENAISNPDVYVQQFPKQRTKRIVAVGRDTTEKDYKTLILAFSKFSNNQSDYILEIYGSGKFKEIKDYAKKLQLVDKIKFMGAHKDVISMINDASCYVLSSNSEGMPNALLEALAIGLPCVSTDCPTGPRELIEDGVNGILVPVGDDEALAFAISKMIEDKEFATKCSKNAMKIRETHSIDFIGNQYNQLFIELISKDNKLAFKEKIIS